MSGEIRYRPEIDGLRAIAIASVLLLHAGFDWIPGGYLGVDIFFVISGYLITHILLRDLSAGQFSILAFYHRRCRRIVPALVVASIFAVAVTLPLMTADQIEHLGRTLTGTSLFYSNFVAFRASGYFGPLADLDPLIHTWSLAVEEQFYIFFPVMMFVLWRVARGGMRGIFVTVVALFCFSLGLSEWLASVKPAANFFLLPSRAWELMAGALCGAWHFRQARRSNGLLAALGLFLIVASLLLFDDATPVPSMVALLPVGGTALVLLFAGRENFVGRALSAPPMVWAGLASYSAYLFHQPVLVALRLHGAEMTAWVSSAAIAATFAIAFVSWKFVEQPFRSRDWRLGRISRGKVLAASALALLMLAGTGFAISRNAERLGLTSPEQVELARLADPETPVHYYRRGSCMLMPESDKVRHDAECLPESADHAIWGDSHAASLSVGLRELGGRVGQLVAGGCPPILGTNAPINPHCPEIGVNTIEELAARPPTRLFLLANWSGYIDDRAEESRLRETLAVLHQRLPATDIVLLGPLPQWFPSLTQALSHAPDPLSAPRRLEVEGLQMRRLRNTEDMLRGMAEAQKGVRFVSILNLLCAGNSCDAMVREGEEKQPLTWDTAHLTRLGSRHVARAILAQERTR